MGDGPTVITAEYDAIDWDPKSRGLGWHGSAQFRNTGTEQTRGFADSCHPAADGSTARAEARGSLICCPQAIFTSIRSPMGQGYRLVAASAGVKAEEKIEITRRSPSHGSLCDPSGEAVGLLSYPLSTGRQCVACCIHAGVEHTARGGLRVYTHIAVLEPSDFEAVEANPLLVHATMLERLRSNRPVLNPPPCLEALCLNIPLPVVPDTAPAATDETTPQPQADMEAGGEPDPPSPADPALAEIAADLQADRCVIVTGATEPMSVLRSLMELLPPEARRRLSVSAGLTYSPGRRLQLVLLPEESAQLGRLVIGQNVAIHRFPRT